VLVVQLLSLGHISWPRHNATATAKLARKILDVHGELIGLIEKHDTAGARALMDDHVRMIRARRVAEHGQDQTGCC
jgi:GntR family transcriptional repressor for pyruvate dehydrogenase complex